MSSVCLIDTSIFLNLLDVPYCNESRAEIAKDFMTFTEAGCTFLLPMATILETGNHIAQNGDGNLLRNVGDTLLSLPTSNGLNPGVDAQLCELIEAVLGDLFSLKGIVLDDAGTDTSPVDPEVADRLTVDA